MTGRADKLDALRKNAARQVAQRERTIAQTFPGNVSTEARERFMQEAQAAIEHYVAWLPPVDEQQIERRGLAAHRPTDDHRHGLVGDLYDAYMTARGDSLEARGFTRTANAVLKAAGLSIKVTDHDFVTMREQRRPFIDYVKRNDEI